MARIVCISCVKSKRPQKCKAEDLYTSPLFRKALAYAKLLRPDRVVILSAKHGVLALADEVEPYEQTLNRMPKAARREWATGVLAQLRQMADFDRDEFIFLAGRRYREELVSALRHWSAPMDGLGLGQQLRWLGQQAIPGSR